MQYDDDKSMKRSAGSATYSRGGCSPGTDPRVGPRGSATVQANMLRMLCELSERSIHTLRDAVSDAMFCPDTSNAGPIWGGWGLSTAGVLGSARDQRRCYGTHGCAEPFIGPAPAA